MPPQCAPFAAENDVLLAPFLGEHVPRLHALIAANRTHLQRWHPWVSDQKSPDDVARLVASWEKQVHERQNVRLGIWRQGVLCGSVGTTRIDWKNQSTWLTYWLGEPFQGQGLMTRSCRLLLAGIFAGWKLNRVTIECAPENTRSCAVAERLGFRREGVVREVEWLHDHFADHVIFALLRADWDKARQSAKLRIGSAPGFDPAATKDPPSRDPFVFPPPPQSALLE